MHSNNYQLFLLRRDADDWARGRGTRTTCACLSEAERNVIKLCWDALLGDSSGDLTYAHLAKAADVVCGVGNYSEAQLRTALQTLDLSRRASMSSSTVNVSFEDFRAYMSQAMCATKRADQVITAGNRRPKEEEMLLVDGSMRLADLILAYRRRVMLGRVMSRRRSQECLSSSTTVSEVAEAGASVSSDSRSSSSVLPTPRSSAAVAAPSAAVDVGGDGMSAGRRVFRHSVSCNTPTRYTPDVTALGSPTLSDTLLAHGTSSPLSPSPPSGSPSQPGVLQRSYHHHLAATYSAGMQAAAAAAAVAAADAEAGGALQQAHVHHGHADHHQLDPNRVMMLLQPDAATVQSVHHDIHSEGTGGCGAASGRSSALPSASAAGPLPAPAADEPWVAATPCAAGSAAAASTCAAVSADAMAAAEVDTAAATAAAAAATVLHAPRASSSTSSSEPPSAARLRSRISFGARDGFRTSVNRARAVEEAAVQAAAVRRLPGRRWSVHFVQQDGAVMDIPGMFRLGTPVARSRSPPPDAAGPRSTPLPLLPDIAIGRRSDELYAGVGMSASEEQLHQLLLQQEQCPELPFIPSSGASGASSGHSSLSGAGARPGGAMPPSAAADHQQQQQHQHVLRRRTMHRSVTAAALGARAAVASRGRLSVDEEALYRALPDIRSKSLPEGGMQVPRSGGLAAAGSISSISVSAGEPPSPSPLSSGSVTGAAAAAAAADATARIARRRSSRFLAMELVMQTEQELQQQRRAALLQRPGCAPDAAGADGSVMGSELSSATPIPHPPVSSPRAPRNLRRPSMRNLTTAQSMSVSSSSSVSALMAAAGSPPTRHSVDVQAHYQQQQQQQQQQPQAPGTCGTLFAWLNHKHGLQPSAAVADGGEAVAAGPNVDVSAQQGA